MLLLACAGSVVLTQTHPAAPYVCRTGNITLRCQYGGVEGVSSVVWFIGLQTTTNPSTIPGHTALPPTTTYQEVVVDNYTSLATGYRCEPTFSNGSQLQSSIYIPQKECECYILQHNFVDSHIPIHIRSSIHIYSSMLPTCKLSWWCRATNNGQLYMSHWLLLIVFTTILACIPLLFTDLFAVLPHVVICPSPAAEVTLSSLTLASRTATTLSVTWSAGYPECYSFTVSHSTQDGSINATRPADRDTSHTLTSLQPGTTYRIEVEAVRKGDGADGQRAKVIENFSTESMYVRGC